MATLFRGDHPSHHLRPFVRDDETIQDNGLIERPAK